MRYHPFTAVIAQHRVPLALNCRCKTMLSGVLLRRVMPAPRRLSACYIIARAHGGHSHDEHHHGSRWHALNANGPSKDGLKVTAIGAGGASCGIVSHVYITHWVMVCMFVYVKTVPCSPLAVCACSATCPQVMSSDVSSVCVCVCVCVCVRAHCVEAVLSVQHAPVGFVSVTSVSHGHRVFCAHAYIHVHASGSHAACVRAYTHLYVC